MRTPSELTELFRAHGRKVTPQRQCIFRALEGAEDHPTAEKVYARVRNEMETISLKTVYQTLHDLADLGEVAALDVGTGAVRFDPNVDRPHHHLVCRSCGKVRDVFADLPSVELPESAARDYDVEQHEIVFRGLCGDCRPLALGTVARSTPGTDPVRHAGPRRHTDKCNQEEQCPS